jgi:hypothetical protein
MLAQTRSCAYICMYNFECVLCIRCLCSPVCAKTLCICASYCSFISHRHAHSRHTQTLNDIHDVGASAPLKKTSHVHHVFFLFTLVLSALLCSANKSCFYLEMSVMCMVCQLLVFLFVHFIRPHV